MIYGDSHAFDELIRRLKLFNGRFRLIGTGLLLEDVIAAAMAQQNADIEDPKVNIVNLPIKLETANSTHINLKVTMHRKRSELVFEKIEWTGE
jgi:hypothetical protein